MVEAENAPEELTFVFEVCYNCKAHGWNTRHDEAKYQMFFEATSMAIQTMVPNGNCTMNLVPKAWFKKKIYNKLIRCENESMPFYDMNPRVGAFEISTVIDGVAIIFYSKLKSNVWPKPDVVAQKLWLFS